MSQSATGVALALILYLLSSALRTGPGGPDGGPAEGMPESRAAAPAPVRPSPAPDASNPSPPGLRPLPARIEANSAVLRSGPGSSFPRITVLPEGTPLLVTDQRGDWYQVQLGSGLAGWVWAPLVAIQRTLSPSSPWPTPGGKSIIGYYVHDPDRPAATTLAKYRGALTAIAVWAWRLEADGSLTADVPPQELAQVVQAAASLGLTTYALVHNYRNDAFDQASAHRLLTDPSAVARAVEAVAGQAARFGLAGITLDLENVAARDRRHLSQFVARLADRLHREGRRLSVAVPARTGDGPSNAYDYAALAHAADQLWLMTYDQHYRTGPPGPVASVQWVEQVVRYAVSQAPAARIVLGLPAYGYEWSRSGRTARGLTYGQAMGRLQASGATLRWHPVHRVPYFTTPDGSEVWFEDRFSAAYKLQLVDRYGLAGVAVWRLGQEDPGLWEAAARTLGRTTH